MVKGLNIFKDYFKEFSKQYVLIGGGACSLYFESQNAEFGRKTRDLDIVLIIEALTAEFGVKFWEFIKNGGYRNKFKGNGKAQFYRFDKPADKRYPECIELFARNNTELIIPGYTAPVFIDDSISSLSAILLDDDYYNALMEWRVVFEDVSFLHPLMIIPFKAKAWLDMSANENADSDDIKKHRNDIYRILDNAETEFVNLSVAIRKDLAEFMKKSNISQSDLKNLGINSELEKLNKKLTAIYGLQ